MVPTKSKSAKKVKKAKKPSKAVKKPAKEKPTYNITKHILVPKHRILSKNEIEKLLKTYNISLQQLPLIKEKDPVIEAIGAKEGDIIEIKRDGPTKSFYFFRRVAE